MSDEIEMMLNRIIYYPKSTDIEGYNQKIFYRLEALNQRIAELTEHIDKIEHGAIFLGHPKEYWLSLNRYAYEGGYEKLIQDNAYHVYANEIAVKLIAELEAQLKLATDRTPKYDIDTDVVDDGGTNSYASNTRFNYPEPPAPESEGKE